MSSLRESVTAVLLHGDEVLAITRQNHLTVFPGYTSFPGGKVDKKDRESGENRFKTALYREVEEELGIDIRPFVERMAHIGEASTPEFQSVRFHTHFYAIELTEKPDFSPDKGEVDSFEWKNPAGWLEAYNRAELLLVPPTRHVFEFLAKDQIHWEKPLTQDFNLRYSSERHVPMLENVKGLIQYLPLSHTFPPANRTNCFLLGDEKKVLIDPSPKGAEEMEKLISSVTRDLAGDGLDLVFLTHHHTDHYERVREIADYFDTPLGMSRDTYERILRDQGEDFFGGREIQFFAEGNLLSTSLGKKVHLYEVPGHDEGQLALAPDDMSWFLAGDLIQTVGTVVIGGDEGDMAKYFASLQRVIDFRPKVVVPSHGIPVGGTSKLEMTLKHRRFREQQVKKELEKGLSAEEILPIVYAGIQEELKPFALKTIHAHIKKIRTQYAEVSPLSLASASFPLRKPVYEVSPGLKPLRDIKDLLWVDRLYEDYMAEKRKCREESREKYYVFSEDFWRYDAEVSHFLDGLALNKGIALKDGDYINSLDRVASHLQEDIAVVKREGEKDRTIAVHLSFPNHWDPRTKLNQDFNSVHRPVADFGPIARRAEQMVGLMIDKGPFTRFAWGLSTDTRLNHHPEPPRNVDPAEWQGRSFDPQNPRLYMRVERQATVGFPKLDCALFTIRTYFFDAREIKQDAEKRDLLFGALSSMSEEGLRYKGLYNDRDKILAWLAD